MMTNQKIKYKEDKTVNFIARKFSDVKWRLSVTVIQRRSVTVMERRSEFNTGGCDLSVIPIDEVDDEGISDVVYQNETAL